MPHEILFTESLGADGHEIVYLTPPESNKLSRLDSSMEDQEAFWGRFVSVLREVLLPRGYPSSVSPDYTEYQIWDTVQAFCSTISHTLTTHAILVGVGVGDREASALSAAITWILKDGIGMAARILFAWLCGSGFDSDCKKWRLFADFVNDAAMLLELSLLPAFPHHSLQLLALTSSMKAVVGVAGGATRAAVTQHQAVEENMGDVSAKDGSQETCVNLLASIIGVLILSYLSHTRYVWAVFGWVTALHLYANYRAVRSLKFRVFNSERFLIALSHYLGGRGVPSPDTVAHLESVFLFCGLTDTEVSGCGVEVGSALQGLGLTTNQLRLLANLYKERRFLVVQGGEGKVHAILSRDSDTRDMLQAYFHALLLGLTASLASSRQPKWMETAEGEESAAKRLLGAVHKMPTRPPAQKLDIEELIRVDQICAAEFISFWAHLQSSGWNLASHQLQGKDRRWRGSWGTHLFPQTDKEHTL